MKIKIKKPTSGRFFKLKKVQNPKIPSSDIYTFFFALGKKVQPVATTYCRWQFRSECRGQTELAGVKKALYLYW